MNGTLKISVPSELAELLVAEGHATATRGRRSGEWSLDAPFLGQATTVIALLQAPQTVEYLARSVRALVSRRRANSGGAGAGGASVVHIEATGPHGQIRFDGEAKVEDIEKLLRQTIFAAENDG
ncbi:hypothetical protein C5F59_038905 [Streptomyces sp. QL37]|uniref:hypothetical protein n=1 Tax=Streptomyces sp. QL37 TaxID=2093747 RepID=UPI000CF1EB86|nr:hypothetical protein [Streptomyces sp. QL37]